MERDRGIAIHEAGHAVAAIVRGGTVLSVTVDVEPRTCYGAGSEADAITSLAGPFAQMQSHVNKESGPADAWADFVARSNGDESMASAMVACFAGGFSDYARATQAVGESGLKAAEAEARAFVGENWSAIERVGEALMRNGTLDGAAVEALVKGVAE